MEEVVGSIPTGSTNYPSSGIAEKPSVIHEMPCDPVELHKAGPLILRRAAARERRTFVKLSV